MSATFAAENCRGGEDLVKMLAKILWSERRCWCRSGAADAAHASSGAEVVQMQVQMQVQVQRRWCRGGRSEVVGQEVQKQKWPLNCATALLV
jgi:hypothetical protein